MTSKAPPTLRLLAAVLSAVALVSCASGESETYNIDVYGQDVLGSYIAYVDNQTDQELTLSCTVTAEGGVGSDTFTITLGPAESGQYEAKMPLDDFTDQYTGSCA